ncbi:MAG: JAB domain-containing protein, partial [bacterium]|nr:JAB domain-containing protein [bacterium]
MRPSVNDTSLESLLTALGNPRGHRLWLSAVSIHPLVFEMARHFDRVTVQIARPDGSTLSDISALPPNVTVFPSMSEETLDESAVFDAALFLGVFSTPSARANFFSSCLRMLRDRMRIMVVELSPSAQTEGQQAAVMIENYLRSGRWTFAADAASWPSLSSLRSQLKHEGLHHLRAQEITGLWTTRFGHHESSSPEVIVRAIRNDLSARSDNSVAISQEVEERLHHIAQALHRTMLAPLNLFVVHGLYKPSRNLSMPEVKSASLDSPISEYSPDMNTCSLSELLSLVMTEGESASRMSKLGGRMLREYGSLPVANERDPRRLSEALAIPIARARQISAMFEIGRRFFSSSDRHTVLLRGPEDIASYAVGMADLRCEQFRVLCIDEQHHLITEEVLGTGTECSASLHPRDALRPALLHRAAALAFVHNHP